MPSYLYIVAYDTAEADDDDVFLAFDHVTVEADSAEDAYLTGGRVLSRDGMLNDYVIPLAAGLRALNGAK